MAMGYMQFSTFEAAAEGDISVLEDGLIAQSFTPDLGDNVVHIATRHGHLTFVEQAINRFPELLRQKNNKENTPLHEAAEVGTKEIVELLISRLQKTETGGGSSSTSTATATVTNGVAPLYLLEKNNKGDTTLHVALRSRNMAAAEALLPSVTTHPQILLIKNNFEETPLHLYVRCCHERKNEKHNVANNNPKVICEMMEANPWAIFIPDCEGLNPVMRAAQYGRVLLLHNICSSYKRTLHFRDSKGRSFLHHLRLKMADDYTLWICKKILEVPGVYTLTYSCDEDGNTPLHLAILEREFDLAYLILQPCVNDEHRAREEFVGSKSVKNNDGKTISHLITSGQHIPANLKNLLERASMGRIMHPELCKAAKKGDVDIFERRRSTAAGNNARDTETTAQDSFDDDDLKSGAEDGSNVLHIAVRYGHPQFIKVAISTFPELMYQRDSNGDTPLHIAARLLSEAAGTNIFFMACHWTGLDMPMWKLKNEGGNSPLHEAARLGNFDNLKNMIFSIISSRHRVVLSEALSDVNKYGETPLHLLATHGNKEFYEMTIIGESNTAMYMRDVNGLTPISRVAQSGHIKLVEDLLFHYQPSIYINDYKGRTMLHHLCTSVLDDVDKLESILRVLEHYPPVFNLIFTQDDDGNTPLHLAIINRNFELAQYIIIYAKKTSIVKWEKFMKLQNNDGKSINNLITCGSHIPLELKKLKLLANEKIMADKVYEAATKGDINVLADYDTSQLVDINEKAHDGSNIIHIALRHHRLHFLREAIITKDQYYLLYWKDSKGDTPLHVAARLPTSVALDFFQMLRKSRQYKIFKSLWEVKNSKGNTFLHEAARFCNYELINEFIDEADIKDGNNHNETMLHVIARYATYTDKDILERVCEQMKSLVYMRDNEGFTPVLRALQCGRLGLARFLIHHSPRSVEIPDDKGRTILHHLRDLVVDLVDDLKDVIPVWQEFLKHPGVDDHRIAQDEDGNTPLHLAIIDANITKAKFLLGICLESKNNRELDIVNNDGQSIYDIFSSQAHLSTTVHIASSLTPRAPIPDTLMSFCITSYFNFIYESLFGLMS